MYRVHGLGQMAQVKPAGSGRDKSRRQTAARRRRSRPAASGEEPAAGGSSSADASADDVEQPDGGETGSIDYQA